MGIIEDIKNMQSQGKNEQDILRTLQQKGYDVKEAAEAIAQAKIKEAVTHEDSTNPQESYSQEIPVQNQNAGMQRSIMSPETEAPQSPSTNNQQEQFQGSAQEQYPVQEQYVSQEQYYPQEQAYQSYPQQYGQSYSSPSNADAITEIAEQIVLEKIRPIKNEVEKLTSMKNTFETKINYLDERLKRIERIIDRLQLSILQKVGEYMTNVEDLKKEMTETQKTFKSSMQKSNPPQQQNQKPSQQNPFSKTFKQDLTKSNSE